MLHRSTGTAVIAVARSRDLAQGHRCKNLLGLFVFDPFVQEPFW